MIQSKEKEQEKEYAYLEITQTHKELNEPHNNS